MNYVTAHQRPFYCVSPFPAFRSVMICTPLVHFLFIQPIFCVQARHRLSHTHRHTEGGFEASPVLSPQGHLSPQGCLMATRAPRVLPRHSWMARSFPPAPPSALHSRAPPVTPPGNSTIFGRKPEVSGIVPTPTWNYLKLFPCQSRGR